MTKQCPEFYAYYFSALFTAKKKSTRNVTWRYKISGQITVGADAITIPRPFKTSLISTRQACFDIKVWRLHNRRMKAKPRTAPEYLK